ncbi:hypothetical protein QTP70_033631 [Hemibagrus guttatus]|uniref:VWC2L-like N-terminal domain-containing protein n=1 Tax=Hemibagrus guttatus TaxID=175788 RepID=A0AAE0UWZ5_9TELE|nr:hypothetical protein QTP70_033631 [Hemibagrus guttatus]
MRSLALWLLCALLRCSASEFSSKSDPDYEFGDYRGKWCIDDHGFVYSIGEVYYPGRAACPCTCTEDGPVCVRPKCPRIHPRCTRIKYKSCCPVCEAISKVCVYGGKIYRMFEEFRMSAEEQRVFSSFSFTSMFMSLPRRSKLLCGESHHSGWRASGSGRMDCLFLYLQRRNLANAPSRHVRTAPAARRRRVQADGGAGDGARAGEREAERERALAQVGCYPMMARASTAWRNTTCAVPSANADLFHPLQTQDIRFTDCILGYVLH